MNKNLATDYWYSMKSAYNFKAGTASNQANADMFTRTVWNIADGKVAFARRGQFVMAWYCPSGKTGINTGNKDSYLAAVKPDTCIKPCKDDITTDLYSKCYNPKAAASHNAKRKDHLVGDLTVDIDIAKRAQALAKKYHESGVFSVYASEECGYNYAKAIDAVQALDKDWATNYWYVKGTGYDWDKKPKSATANDFTNMIWRGSRNVGFGVYGDKVVALYCVKGNVEGKFGCNVCKTGKGCDKAACPPADSICQATDGEGSAEISLRADKKSIRIIATVKKNQYFAIGFGNNDLLKTDIIVFYAKKNAAASSAFDSKQNIAMTSPNIETQQAITVVTKTDQGDYIRFDTTRALNTGYKTHYPLTLGAPHKMMWAQWKTMDFATLTNKGTCSFNIADTKSPLGCPNSKRDSNSDPKRQEDCSPEFNKGCYDVKTGLFANSYCSGGSKCAKWEASVGGVKYMQSGCILRQYCGTTGDY